MPYARIEINDLANVGSVADTESYQLPPEAWTTAHNMRFEGIDVVRMKGWEPRLGSPPEPPHFALAFRRDGEARWLWTSLKRAYEWNGLAHSEITRSGGVPGTTYGTTQTRQWGATLFGGTPILNNGVDVPQFFDGNLGRLADLVDWPSTWRTRRLLALGPFLVGLGMTIGSASRPHQVNWSHPAAAGTLPISWDIKNPIYDAGEIDLPDVENGSIVDGLPLRGSLIIYKEAATWILKIVGGQKVLDADTLYDTSGILAPRCASLVGTGARHFVVTQDDIILHNGQGDPVSLVDRRQRRTVFNEIDPTNYINSFTFCHAAKKEMWFCYPTKAGGQKHPDKALVWNYENGQLGVHSTSDVTFRNAAVGPVDITAEATTPLIWEDAAYDWGDEEARSVAAEEPWNRTLPREVILCDTDNQKFQLMESSNKRNGVQFESTLSREGLAIIGKKRDGSVIVDFGKYKTVRRIWIKANREIEAPEDSLVGAFQVRMGFQITPPGPVAWTPYKPFNPNTQMFLDFEGAGRAIAVEFRDTIGKPWKIVGYEPEIAVRGTF